MTYLLLFFLTTVMFSQDQKATSLADFIPSFEQKISELLEANKIPGLAIALIDQGEIVYKKGLGAADIKNDIPLSSKTGFNIGSVSKMFAAWGVMKLVENGKIDLDAPAENYLSRWKLPKSAFDHKKVTVRHLLGHTAGISVHGYPGFPPDTKLPTLEASLDGENGPARANEKVEIIAAPQTEFKYSGGGYSILQLLIEEVTGQSFEDYMEMTIFRPLKMKNTSFIIDRKILKNSAKPYDKEGKEIYLERFTAKAAAGLHTTLDDLVLFAKGSLKGNKVLSESSINTMKTPSKLSKGNYGLGHVIYSFGNIVLKGHTGTNTGWESAFLLDSENDFGIIMLCNISEGDRVMRKILRQWVQWKMTQLKTEK